jgi:hypothetical protein
MQGISYAIEECKNIWTTLQKEKGSTDGNELSPRLQS